MIQIQYLAAADIFLREAGAGGSNPLSPTIFPPFPQQKRSRFDIVALCSAQNDQETLGSARATESSTQLRADRTAAPTPIEASRVDRRHLTRRRFSRLFSGAVLGLARLDEAASADARAPSSGALAWALV